MRELFKQQT